MRMKENHEHIDFNGYCDDWEEEVHAEQYDNYCLLCVEEFQDGEEFLELRCTHVYHSKCIEDASNEANFNCLTCQSVNIRRWRLYYYYQKLIESRLLYY